MDRDYELSLLDKIAKLDQNYELSLLAKIAKLTRYKRNKYKQLKNAEEIIENQKKMIDILVNKIHKMEDEKWGIKSE